jgi:hypothetical protein
MRLLIVFLLAVPGLTFAQSGLEVVKNYYSQTLTALQQAKTKDDLTKLIESLDTADWVSIDPSGFVVLTRGQVSATLEPLLAIEAGKRPLPNVEVLWVHQEPWRVTAVSMILGPSVAVPNPPRAASKTTFGPQQQPHFALAGSLIRDTFAHTVDGWRRIKHEKLLPDQFRVPDGESTVVAPK